MLTSCVRNRLTSFNWMNICWRLSYVLHVSVDYSKLLRRFVFIDTLSGRQEPWPMFPLLPWPVCLCLCFLEWLDPAIPSSRIWQGRRSGPSPGAGGRSQQSRSGNLTPCFINVHHLSTYVDISSYNLIHTNICMFPCMILVDINVLFSFMNYLERKETHWHSSWT